MNCEQRTKPGDKWALPFFTIWSVQALSLLGSQLVQFALIWWLTKTTGSATVLAMATLVGLVPSIILGPVAGALFDRWNRRVIMIVADAVIAAATVGLAILFWTGYVQIWHIYSLMFVRSLAGVFHRIAMQTSTSLMVPKEHLARVQGLNQMLNGGLNIASAPLGALLLELLSMQSILFIDVSTAIVAILPLFFIFIPQPMRSSSPSGETGSSIWQELKLGFQYVRGWPGLLLIGLLATFINLLLTPAFTLIPLLVTQHFGGGAFQLAWIDSIAGVGIIAGGLLLGVWGGFKRRIVTSLAGLIGIGFGAILMGVTPEYMFPLGLAAALIIGFSLPITNGPLHAALQATVAPDMQGRVFTLIESVVSAMSPLGLLIAGPVSDLVGVQSWFLMGGVISVLMGIIGLLIPAIIHFEDGREYVPDLEIGKRDLATEVGELP